MQSVKPHAADDMASTQAMADWAYWYMGLRKPDLIIGEDYIRRWHVIPRNPGCNVYLHHILHSDDDRALHDHQYDNTSMVLAGSYIEHTKDGRSLCKAGDIVQRKAADLHRLELFHGLTAVSLFITGPRIREWGFDCPDAWRHNSLFLDPDNYGKRGPGCD